MGGGLEGHSGSFEQRSLFGIHVGSAVDRTLLETIRVNCKGEDIMALRPRYLFLRTLPQTKHESMVGPRITRSFVKEIHKDEIRDQKTRNSEADKMKDKTIRKLTK